jgi:hypothetical protein
MATFDSVPAPTAWQRLKMALTKERALAAGELACVRGFEHMRAESGRCVFSMRSLPSSVLNLPA